MSVQISLTDDSEDVETVLVNEVMWKKDSLDAYFHRDVFEGLCHCGIDPHRTIEVSRSVVEDDPRFSAGPCFDRDPLAEVED